MNALASALPGQHEVDEGLLEQARVHISRLCGSHSTAWALALGTYIIDTFFGGCERQFREVGKKHSTFEALRKRVVLPVSKSTLWYAAKFVPYIGTVPDKARELTFSHHREVMHLKDIDHRNKLLLRAWEESWTTKRLREEVRKDSRGEEAEREADGAEDKPRDEVRSMTSHMAKWAASLSEWMVAMKDAVDSGDVTREALAVELRSHNEVLERIWSFIDDLLDHIEPDDDDGGVELEEEEDEELPPPRQAQPNCRRVYR